MNAIAPGTVLTDMNREVMVDSTYRQRAIDRIPSGGSARRRRWRPQRSS